MKASILQKQKMASPLGSLRRIEGEAGGKRSKTLSFGLNLTTLIDAFCILVIFLLSNMNGQVQNIKVGEKMILPTAMQTENLTEGLAVRIEQNNIFVDDKPVPKEALAKAILDAKKPENASMIIQADRKSDYENIGLVLRAGGQAGYEKYVFAVLPGR